MRDSITLGVGAKALTITLGELAEGAASLNGRELFELLRMIEEIHVRDGVFDERAAEYESARLRAKLLNDPVASELLAGLEAMGMEIEIIDLGAMLEGELLDSAPFPNLGEEPN